MEAAEFQAQELPQQGRRARGRLPRCTRTSPNRPASTGLTTIKPRREPRIIVDRPRPGKLGIEAPTQRVQRSVAQCGQQVHQQPLSELTAGEWLQEPAVHEQQ